MSSAYRTQTSIDMLVIHYSATPDGAGFTALDIDKWHAGRGFQRAYAARLGEEQWGRKSYAMHQPHLRAIGYHYVIRVNGLVECGRRVSETGAHAKGVNQRSIGVCLIGLGRFSRRQWAALQSLVEGLQRDRTRDGLPPLRVIGHRDVPGASTNCPGFDVADWLATGMRPMDGHVVDVESAA